MRLLHADISFTDSSTNYVYETSAPVSLTAAAETASIPLIRTDTALGSGDMKFSLVDSAEDASVLHAMSAFTLTDTTSTPVHFTGTAAYNQSTPSVPDTAASGLQVLAAKQYGSAQACTLAAIDSNSRVTLDDSGLPELITTEHNGNTACSSCSVLAGGIADGSVGSDGGLDVSWGRWASDEVEGSFAGNDISLQQLHFIESNNRTPDIDITNLSGSGSGIITYDLIGGSAPTDQAGNIGSYNSATVGVDFGAQQIQSMNINMLVNDQTIILQNNGTADINGILSGGAISLQSGGGDVSGLSGNANAVFIGNVTTVTGDAGAVNVPPGVMSAFGASNSTDSVSGAVLLGNPAGSGQ